MAGNAQFIYQKHVEIDKLIEEFTPYLRKKINPMDIVRDLLDLSESDRQQIECQTKQNGEIRGMDKLLECIVRRRRKCFFDFLVLLENNKYSDQSDHVIKKAKLINLPELVDARKRYNERYGEDIECVPRHPQHGSVYVAGIRQNNTPNVGHHSDRQHCTPGICEYPVTGYPPVQPHQQHVEHNSSRDQGIGISNTLMIQHMQNVPGERDRLGSYLPGNGHHSNIPGLQGCDETSSHNLGQRGQGIPFKEINSLKNRKTDFEIHINPFDEAGAQINPETMGSQFGSIQGDLFVEQGNAAVPRDIDNTSLLGPISTKDPPHIQTYQNDGQQRVGTGQMHPRDNILRQNLMPALQREQPVPLSHQQVIPRNLEDDKAVGDLPDEVFSKLATALSREEGSPLWRKVGQKAGMTRTDIRSIEKEPNPAEKLLDMLHDKYSFTVKKLCEILRQAEAHEALQILQGRGTLLEPNISVSDDENAKINNLSHLGGRSIRNEDETSGDFNTKLSEKDGPEKVIETISTLFCREPHEHEHLKCEANEEVSSSVSESCSKSIESDKLDSAVMQPSQYQMETTIEAMEAETDQENKNAEMDAVCLSEDISANRAMETVTTTSVISNKIQNWNLESTEERGEVSGVQAQGDANLLRSEKPPDQEMVRLQQEIQTQPNLSSFRDLQHSVLSNENDRLSTLSASEENLNITRSNIPHYQGFQNRQISDAEYLDMSQECTVDGKSKNKIKEDFSLGGKQVIKQNSELTPQEVSNCGSNFPDRTTTALDVYAVKAEGDQNLKQSALPPNLDHQNFTREIGTQQSTVEDCPEQLLQGNSNTAVPGAYQRVADSLPNPNSFRDIQHSVPEYRSEDLENPNSSLPRNVDSLVMDEEETFLKERHRQV